MNRNTTTRDRHRKAIAQGKPPCGICGEPIDYQLPHTDPRSFVVDHIIPLSASDDDSLANKQAAHRDCNRDKSNTMNHQVGVTYITDRNWWATTPDTPGGITPTPTPSPHLGA